MDDRDTEMQQWMISWINKWNEWQTQKNLFNFLDGMGYEIIIQNIVVKKQ